MRRNPFVFLWEEDLPVFYEKKKSFWSSMRRRRPSYSLWEEEVLLWEEEDLLNLYEKKKTFWSFKRRSSWSFISRPSSPPVETAWSSIRTLLGHLSWSSIRSLCSFQTKYSLLSNKRPSGLLWKKETFRSSMEKKTIWYSMRRWPTGLL